MASGMAKRSPISVLQEIMAQRKKLLPTYVQLSSDIREYKFRCIVLYENESISGYGHTKKESKHNAAQEAINKIHSESSLSRSEQGDIRNKLKAANYVGILNEQSSAHKVAFPVYDEKCRQNGQFTTVCQHLNLTSEGFGTNKKAAKQMAAEQMLKKMEMEKVTYPPVKSKSKRRALLVENEELIQKILKKYDELTVTHPEPLPTSSKSAPEPIPEFEEHFIAKNVDEVVEKLREMGHKPVVEIFQVDPFIHVLKVHKDCVVMGHGETIEESLDKLLENSNDMFSFDFSFKSHFDK